MAEFKVGDRVHIRGCDRDIGNGVITAIEREHNFDWVWFDAIYVEYEKPMQGVWPYLNRLRYRGRHVAENLEFA